MKSFLHYRLVIFAALITCGVFTGSCRADTDISCLPLFNHISLNDGDKICFSHQPVAVCPKICHPVASYDVDLYFSCLKKGELFGEKTEYVKTVSLPDRCELTLPVTVKQDAAQ